MEREQLARAYAVELVRRTIAGAEAGVLPEDVKLQVHAAKITNGSGRPIYNVTCIIDAHHPSLTGAPLDRKFAVRVGEFVDVVLSPGASVEKFNAGEEKRCLLVLRSGHKGAFVWPFDTSQYLRPQVTARFTDDAGFHWQIDHDLHLTRLQSRKDW